MTTAANSLQDAQAEYSRIYWENRKLEDELRKFGQELSQESRDEEAAALRAVSNAEESLTQARLAYEQAQRDEITGIAQAEAQLRDAATQLAEVQAGASEAELASARASVASARANLAELRSGATAAELASAQAGVDQARISLDALTAPAAESSIASAAANLAQAEVAVAQAERDLEQAVLTAPFDGVVSEVAISVGDSAGSDTSITVIDPANLSIELSLSESDVGVVAVGLPVELSFDALPDLVLRGEVAAVAPTATVTSNVATYLVRVAFTADNPAIKVGMTASGSIIIEEHADVLLVPSRAIQGRGERQFLNVQQSEGQPPVPVEVSTGLVSDGQTEILSCMETGDLCLQEGDTLLIVSSSDSTSDETSDSGTVFSGFPGGPPPGSR